MEKCRSVHISSLLILLDSLFLLHNFVLIPVLGKIPLTLKGLWLTGALMMSSPGKAKARYGILLLSHIPAVPC